MPTESIHPFILEIGYKYRCVTASRFQCTSQNHGIPSFLGTNKIGARHRVYALSITCCYSISSISAFSNSFELGSVQYGSESTDLVWITGNLMHCMAAVIHPTSPSHIDWKSYTCIRILLDIVRSFLIVELPFVNLPIGAFSRHFGRREVVSSVTEPLRVWHKLHRSLLVALWSGLSP